MASLELESQDRVALCGVTGSGKTYFVREHVFKAHRKVLAWDPHGDYVGSHTHVLSMAEFAKLSKALANMTSFHVVVRPGKHDSDKAAVQEFRDFYKLCEALFEDTTIIIEEVGLWHENAPAERIINNFATQSRHWGCPIVFVAQRLVQIPPIARSQANTVVAFHQKSDLDIRAARLYFKEKAPELERLPRRRFMLWREAMDFPDS